MNCPQCGMHAEDMIEERRHYACDCFGLWHEHDLGEWFTASIDAYLDDLDWHYYHTRDVTEFEDHQLPGFVPFERCVRMVVFL